MIEKIFDVQGDFASYNAAEDWCRENGVSFGSMCSPSPTGLMWGEIVIAKWRNLTTKEIRQLHGTLEPMDGNYRSGRVLLKLKEKGQGVIG